MLPQNSRLLFKGIVGSQSYGLATEISDTDYKSIYLQTNEDILSNNYIAQVDLTKDDVAYEIRRFLELVSTGNPNVLELLFLPEDCILKTSPEYEYLRNNRDIFLTKTCYYTYSGYAKTQLQKASGINKKFNWEENRIERKDVLDFCKVVDRQNGKTIILKEWLKTNEYIQDQCGLAQIEGFRDCYRLYTDDIKWVSDNHRFADIEFENRNYKGIADENSNEPRKSEIEKYRIDDWKGIIYWNREAYSTHCSQYKEYQAWLINRNPVRTATNKKHGQSFDGKNIMHTVRLIMTAMEIPTQKRINVSRLDEREYLLKIKNGEVNLKNIIEEWSLKADDMKKLYDESNLPDNVDKQEIKKIELWIRKKNLK